MNFKVFHGLPFTTTFIGTTSEAFLTYKDGLFGKATQIPLKNNIQTLDIVCGANSDEITVDMLLCSGERVVAVCEPSVYRILYVLFKRY